MTEYLNYQADLEAQAVVAALDETSLWSMAFGRLLLSQLALLPGIKGLDLGCGTGFPLLELANLHDSTCHFTGLDVWRGGLARAHEKQGVYGLSNVELIHLTGDHFPLPDATFDLITANLVLNNLDQPAITLGECARVAKPGARIAATTNLNGHMHEFYAVFAGVLSDLKFEAAVERLRASEARRGTVESHVQTLEMVGFRVSKRIEETLTLRYLNGSAFLRHWFIRVAFLPSWKAVSEEPDQVLVFRTLESRLNEISQEQGELRLTVPMLYLEGIRV